MHVFIYIYTDVHLQMSMCKCLLSIYVKTCKHVCTYICVYYVYLCICIHTCVHVQRQTWAEIVHYQPGRPTTHSLGLPSLKNVLLGV